MNNVLKKIKTTLMLVILGFAPGLIQAQKEILINNKLIHIETYGLEVENTTKLICSLMQDTNNFLIIDYYGGFDLNSLYYGYHEFYDNEHPACADRISKLKNCIDLNRVIGYDLHRRFSIPVDYLSDRDKDKFNELLARHQFDAEAAKLLNDPKKITEMCVDIVKTFEFNRLDSMLLFKNALDQNLTVNDFASVGIIDKNFIYIHQDYSMDFNRYKKLISEPSQVNQVYIMVPKEGATDNRVKLVNVKNKIKVPNDTEDFVVLKREVVPKKIKIAKGLTIDKEQYPNVGFLLVNKLSNCIW